MNGDALLLYPIDSRSVEFLLIYLEDMFCFGDKQKKEREREKVFTCQILTLVAKNLNGHKMS